MSSVGSGAYSSTRSHFEFSGPSSPGRGTMSDKPQQKQRTNRVFKSLHKPLTYLGVERTLFYFVCVGAVGAFNLFNSILAGIAVFVGGFAFGHWVTNSDPAFLRILAKSERYKLRYDAAKQQVPRVEVM
jgi:type IV secretory pathway TrbD component